MRTAQLLAAMAGIWLFGVCGGAAAAEDEKPFTLDSIMVTARKVEADKQEVPASISVFDSKTMNDFGLDNLASLTNAAANIGLTKVDNVTNQVVFRGVGGMSNMNKVWNVSVDGVTVPYVAIDTFLDVDRIEFLRGSQGAFYGRNTYAGAINVITKDPGAEQNGDISVDYERFNTFRARAAAGGPISDELSYRLAVGFSRSDGYIRNTYLDRDDTNNSEQYTARGKIVAETPEAGKLTLSLYADKYNSGFDSYRSAEDSLSTRTENNRPGYSNGHLFSPSVTWEKDFGSFAVTSITNYSRSKYSYLQDWDFSRYDLQYSTYDEDFSTLSQELRFSGGEAKKLQWMAGVFGLWEKIDTTTDVIFGNDSAAWGFNPGDHALQDSTIDTYIASTFGQLTYRPFSRVELSGALRLDYEKKKLDWKNKTNISWFATDSLRMSEDWVALSPSASAAWLFSEDQRVYVSVARGFKAGDFNNVMVEASVVGDPVDPEYTWTYEVGYKGKLLENRLELNAALFYIDWDDMQVDIEDPDSVFGNFQKMNAGKAHSMGMEVEARALLMPNWEVFANAGWMFKYEFKEFKRDEDTDFKGNKLPNTNAYTVGFGSAYRHPSGFFVGLDGSFNGRKHLVEDNSIKQPGYLLLNAKIGYETKDWDVYLFGRNLLDKRYATTAFSGARRVGEPMVVGVQCVCRF